MDACECQRGYFASCSDSYGWSIERCDTCARFLDDDAALEAAIEDCLRGSEYAARQLRTVLLQDPS